MKIKYTKYEGGRWITLKLPMKRKALKKWITNPKNWTFEDDNSLIVQGGHNRTVLPDGTISHSILIYNMITDNPEYIFDSNYRCFRIYANNRKPASFYRTTKEIATCQQ